MQALGGGGLRIVQLPFNPAMTEGLARFFSGFFVALVLRGAVAIGGVWLARPARR